MPCGPGFGTLEEVDKIADKREDRGLWLAGLALVLEVIRLLVELLRRNHLPLLRERVMIVSYYEVAGIKRFHGSLSSSSGSVWRRLCESCSRTNPALPKS